MSTDGKYVVTGNPLALNPKSGKKEIFTFNLNTGGNLIPKSRQWLRMET